ncbi:MAG TPA: hypothetical protein VGF24_24595 [Vicinamibacterales bacterium]
MNQRIDRLVARGVFAIVVAVLATAVYAEENAVAGDWTFTVEGMALTMTLEQTGKAITGTLQSPHGPIPIKGQFEKDTITFTGGVEGVQLSATGTLQPDGSLAGELSMNVGNMTWKAVRTRALTH